MNCIAAIETQDGTYIGADGIASHGYNSFPCSRPKVFKNGSFIFGVSGSFRTQQILEFNWSEPSKTQWPVVPPPPLEFGNSLEQNNPIECKEIEDDRYIYKNFIESVISEFKENGACKNDGGIISFSGPVIFAFKGSLYGIENDFSILKSKNGYMCGGPAKNKALASLYSTEGLYSHKKRIKKAIECASEFVTSVNDDISIIFQDRV